MQIDEDIGRILNKDPKMIRFFAARMLIELTTERCLTAEEQHKVFNQCGKKRFREVTESGIR